MKLCGWERYHTQVYDKICAYAFENHEEIPLIKEVPLDWEGQIFEVSDIETELHKDLIEDLKALNMLDDIKANTDKFVILPDVFSTRQLAFDMRVRQQFDTDRRNVLRINGRVLNIIMANMTHYVYNHNGYTYTFYKDSESQGIFNNGRGKLTMLSLRSTDVILKPDYNQAVTIVDSKRYWLPLTLDYKVLQTADGTPRVDLIINRDFFRFTIEETVSEDPFEELPGNKSVEWHDAWTSPKMRTFTLEGNYIHNPNVILSTTALVLYKDGTWKQEILSMSGPGEHLEKIDKHTVKVNDTTNVKEFIVFYIDHRREDFSMVDSVYYKCLDVNPRAFLELKGSQKNTNELHSFIKNRRPSLKELIDYGYKYDADVLKVVDDFFRTRWSIEVETCKWTHKMCNGEFTYEPKLEIKAINRLRLRPIVFINGRIFDVPFNIRQIDDLDYIYLDYGALCDFIGVNKLSTRGTKKEVENAVIAQFNGLLEAIDVVFVQFNKLVREYTSAVLYKSKVMDNFMWEEFGGRKIRGRFYGDLFVNGYLTPEVFPDKNNLNSVRMLRRLEGVNPFELGKLNFKNSNPVGLIAGDDWKYEESGFVDGVCIFDNLGKVGAYYRCKEKLRGTVRTNLGYTYRDIIDIDNYNNLSSELPRHYDEHSSLMFDSQGRLVHNLIVYGDKVMWKGGIPIINNLDENSGFYTIMNPIKKNDMYGLDLSIDWEAVHGTATNVQCYNYNTIRNFGVDIMQMVIFGEGSVSGKDAEVKTVDEIVAEKLKIRYWYSNFGKPFDSGSYSTEIAGIDEQYIRGDGSKNGLVESLCSMYFSEKRWYDIYKAMAKFNRKREAISIATEIINNSKKYNSLNSSPIEEHFIGKELRLNGMINITNRGVD